MSAMSKILMGAAVLSLLACSDSSTSASDGVADKTEISSSPGYESICDPNCEPDFGECTSEECFHFGPEINNIDFEDANIGLDVMYPALISQYSDQWMFRYSNVSMDSLVIAYYAEDEVKKQELDFELGITKLDEKALSKIPPLYKRLTLRGHMDGCNYYAVASELPGYRSENLISQVTSDSIVVYQLFAGDGTCEAFSTGKEVYILEDCGDSLNADIPVVQQPALYTSSEGEFQCNNWSFGFGKWFREDIYYAGSEMPSDSDDDEEEIPDDGSEGDELVSNGGGADVCYTPCPADADVCIDVCADYPYVATE